MVENSLLKHSKKVPVYEEVENYHIDMNKFGVDEIKTIKEEDDEGYNDRTEENSKLNDILASKTNTITLS